MAFDARSLKRLEDLGRQLPQPLPTPESTRAHPSETANAPKRHRLETETDPQRLFRELMQASPDGSVPQHLLDRLRQLETKPPLTKDERSTLEVSQSQAAARPKTRITGLQRRQAAAERSQDPLYVSFEQMLLEDEAL